MKREEVNQLMHDLTKTKEVGTVQLVETHISWVLLGQHLVYKIKKPIGYPFLDFTSLEKRKYFCEREVLLNSRLAHEMYLGVVAITNDGQSFAIEDAGNRHAVEYAVKMKRMDTGKQMDILLKANGVSAQDIINLTSMISDFHLKAEIVAGKNPLDVKEKFQALNDEFNFLTVFLSHAEMTVLRRVFSFSNQFVDNYHSLLLNRLLGGMCRDVHGDLHARNIFLLPHPVIFDCIEFNDEYRQIDVLNEMAFLCMDLDAFGRSDLSETCINHYTAIFPTTWGDQEKALFRYYKMYRANVRAKVNSLRAKSALDEAGKQTAIAEVKKYVDLMGRYLSTFRFG